MKAVTLPEQGYEIFIFAFGEFIRRLSLRTLDENLRLCQQVHSCSDKISAEAGSQLLSGGKTASVTATKFPAHVP